MTYSNFSSPTVRAFGVGQVAQNPTIPTVPLPGGREISMASGAWAFFRVTLATMVMLARAGWGSGGRRA